MTDPDVSIEKPSEDGEQSELVYRQRSVQIEGPLPIPDMLAHYEEVLPGAADRIMKMAEREQAHRQKMNAKLVDAQVDDAKKARDESRLGQWLGFAIGLLTIVGGSTTAILGAQVAGTFIGVSGVTGLVSVFVLGRDKDKGGED